MEIIKTKQTADSPAVTLDHKNGHFEIRGNSMPENARAFYQPVLEWLDVYSSKPNPETDFIFQMNLLNTSSTKIFTDIFKKITKISEKSNVKITWYYVYGDEDIQEVGVDFKNFAHVPFELVPIHT